MNLEKTNHVYKTIHKYTNEFYIGSRTSNNWNNRKILCDVYSGSFSYKKWKYDIDQSDLEKEILIYGLSKKETIELEYYIINEVFNDPKNVNMVNPLNHDFNFNDTSGTVPVKNLNNGKTYRVPIKEYENNNHLEHVTKGLKRDDLIERNKNNHPWIGKSHSEKTKKKMSDARKEYWTIQKRKEMSKKMSGENRPLYNIPRKDHHSSKRVRHIDSAKIFDSLSDAGDFYNVCRQTISNHCHNKIKKPKWKFI